MSDDPVVVEFTIRPTGTYDKLGYELLEVTFIRSDGTEGKLDPAIHWNGKPITFRFNDPTKESK